MNKRESGFHRDKTTFPKNTNEVGQTCPTEPCQSSGDQPQSATQGAFSQETAAFLERLARICGILTQNCCHLHPTNGTGKTGEAYTKQINKQSL